MSVERSLRDQTGPGLHGMAVSGN